MKSDLNYHSVIRVMGVLFMLIGLAMVPSMIVALIYGEYIEIKSFIYTALPCLVVGLVLMYRFKPSGLKIKQRDVYLIVTLAWLISSIIGAFPLVIAHSVAKPVDAFFEICSGFSTTGASILEDIEAQSKSILFWRSFTHWLGGMGIIVFMAALLPSMGVGAQMVAGAETPGPTMSKVRARFSDAAKDLYKLYMIFTGLEVILLMIGGLNLYDALIHSFGTVGTGGFSNYNDSVAHFHSLYVEIIIIVFMIICGINFNLYFLIPKKKIRAFFADEELRWYLGIIGVFTVLISIMLIIQGGYDNPLSSIRDSAFQVVSVITTTGFVTENYELWPVFCKILIIFLMISGACSSSTGGGVKVVRVMTSVKYVRRGFLLRLRPKRVSNLRFNNKKIPQQTATDIVYFVFLYVAFLFIGTFLISFDGFGITTNFSAALTCLSNVGPGLEVVGPASNFSQYSDFSTLVLSILMIAGRLELFTFIMLFSPHFWDSNRV